MSVAWQFYISTVLIYLGVDVIACWGLNLQFGVAGLVNFAFIIFQAAGAYTAAVLTLGPAQPASQGGFQQYVGGAHWPFPLPILAAGLVGGLLAALVGGFTVRRLRSDYEAMVMLVVSLIATSVATNQVGLVNGPNGLALVPKPLSTLVNLSPVDYQWLFVGITAAICVCVYWLVHIVTSSPLGRTLRAVRDNEQAAAALGKNVTGLRMLAFILGGVIAGISGAVLVMFISAWSPGSWLYPETFVYFTAVIVGGVRQQPGRHGRRAARTCRLPRGHTIPASVRPAGAHRRPAVDRRRCARPRLLVVLAPWRDSRAAAALPGGRQGRGARGDREVSDLSAPVLAVQDLHREFGGVHAVNGASFTVPPGRITGLIGPNGAGKSTALNIIAGALKPSAGTVSYRGKDITGLPSYKVARRGIIRTFQLSSEFAALTVLENLLVAAPAQRGEALWQAALGKRYWRPQERAMVERARQLMARFDMSAKEDEYAGNLSGGQKRLLELMRGLMTDPALLLLDEPMAGVNPSLARRIEQHLADLVGEGLTMLMIEHELAVVERLCDPVVVMAQGRVISQGTMADVRSDQEVLDAYLIG